MVVQIDGQDIDQLIIGQEVEGKKKVWIHARQHPGESMGSWWIEGFVNRLLDEDEPISRYLLDKAVFYVCGPYIDIVHVQIYILYQ